MGRDEGEMAGDITLTLALLWKAMSHLQDTTQEKVLWQSVLAIAEPVVPSIQFKLKIGRLSIEQSRLMFLITKPTEPECLLRE